jgi:hypothetical protein
VLAFRPEVHDVGLHDVILREDDIEWRGNDHTAVPLFPLAQHIHQVQRDALVP